MQLIANLIFKILIACFFFCYAGGYLLDYEGIPETPDCIVGTKNAAVKGMKAVVHKGTVGVVNFMRAGNNYQHHPCFKYYRIRKANIMGDVVKQCYGDVTRRVDKNERFGFRKFS